MFLSAATCDRRNNNSENYLRLHIRANSNSAADQAVKYKVKDGLAPLIAAAVKDCKTKQEAQNALQNRTGELSRAALEILRQNDFDYTASASLCNEFFPARDYDGLTLDSGYYDALIIRLGSGSGDNWWCVVYPQLCFYGSGEGTVQYESWFAKVFGKK